MPPWLLKALSQSSAYPDGVDGTVGDITQIAEQKLQMLASSAAHQQFPSLAITTTASVTFVEVLGGACANPPSSMVYFDAPGAGPRCRAHVFQASLSFSIPPCHNFVTIDLHLTIQLRPLFPTLQGNLIAYNIDNISSPFGYFNDQIRAGVTQSLNAQFGQDLIGVTVPDGVVVLAVIVTPSGDLQVYQESSCSQSTALMTADPSLAATALPRLRALRQNFLLERDFEQDILRLIDVFGPIVIARLRQQSDFSLIVFCGRRNSLG